MRAFASLKKAGRLLADPESLTGMLLRTLMPVAAMLFVFLLVNLFVFVPLLEKQSLEEKKELCLRLTEIVISDLTQMQQKVARGEIPQEQAQAMMLVKIRQIRFGRDGKDYFWVIAPDGRLLVHPYRPDLEGVDPEKTVAPDGSLLAEIIDDMILVSARHGGGFVYYRWDRRDQSALGNKVSYVYLFQPWGWIVGTGVYLDEVERDVAGWRRQLISLGLILALIAAGVSLFFGYRMVIARREEQKLNRSLAESRRRLEASESMFRGIFNTGPDGIVICNLAEGLILETNPAAATLLQCSPEECRGKLLFDRVRFTTKGQSRDRIVEAGKNGESIRNLSAMVHLADGTGADLLLSVAPINYYSQPALLVMLVDVTETHKMEAELTRARKFDILGQLAGGVAHDFNNMLAGIIGSADMLRLLLGDESEHAEYVKTIRSAAESAAGLTRKLLAFARGGQGMQQQVDVHEQINLALDIFSRSSGRQIDIERALDANQPVVCGDQDLLQNSFLNLALNARDAMPDGGKLVVRTANRELDDAFCLSPGGGIEPGPYLEIIVEDNGLGIEQERLDRIFEPFYTTKPKGQGTGLGLATVYGTMRRHGGTVIVRSEAGQGTVFTIYLPLSMRACSGEEPINTTSTGPIRGSGTVMVVDDEELVRNTTSAMLRALGYSVLVAESGQQALEILSEQSEKVDLVLLDVVMPGLSGPETALRIREMWPGIKIIFCSGYTRYEDDRELTRINVQGFLHKPFVLADLGRIVAEVMGEDQAT